MIEEIYIRDLGVIQEARLPFGKGLTVITGETGAGKTMILTALNLVLGGKSDSSLVKSGADRLTTSATFTHLLTISSELQGALEETDCQIEDGSLIFSRSVNADGKSKALCNGSTVPASVLAQLSEYLIEIHGQSANLQLTKPARQIGRAHV